MPGDQPQCSRALTKVKRVACCDALLPAPSQLRQSHGLAHKALCQASGRQALRDMSGEP